MYLFIVDFVFAYLLWFLSLHVWSVNQLQIIMKACRWKSLFWEYGVRVCVCVCITIDLDGILPAHIYACYTYFSSILCVGCIICTQPITI